MPDPMTPPTLILFDLDGTLTMSAGAGMRAIGRAFEERFGLQDTLSDIAPDGKTDPLIFREIMHTRGLGEADGDTIADLAGRYERFLHEEMPRSRGARVMPGVVRLLQALEARSDVLVGLLTGNLETTARIKLDRFGLNRFFAFGAFASDDELRDRLVPIAVRRAQRHGDHSPGLGRHVYVVGDTPRDVQCALSNGATAVGVGTGRYGPEELLQAGAHIVFDDLGDTEAVLGRLGL